jgi:predicted MFS family arabinose efflux permease
MRHYTVGLIQTHLVPHALDLGLPQVEAAKILGLIGLVNAVGLLVFGWAADRWGARGPLIAVYLVRAVALLWLASALEERMLVPFAIAFGMTDMATIPLVASGTASLFGRQSVGALYGLAALGHQVGSALGAWLGGQGYVFWGSYQPVILVGAGLATIAAIMAASLERRVPVRMPQPV